MRTAADTGHCDRDKTSYFSSKEIAGLLTFSNPCKVYCASSVVRVAFQFLSFWYRWLIQGICMPLILGYKKLVFHVKIPCRVKEKWVVNWEMIKVMHLWCMMRIKRAVIWNMSKIHSGWCCDLLWNTLGINRLSYDIGVFLFVWLLGLLCFLFVLFFVLFSKQQNTFFVFLSFSNGQFSLSWTTYLNVPLRSISHNVYLTDK